MSEFYNAAAVFQSLPGVDGVPYLCKFAVTEQAIGNGEMMLSVQLPLPATLLCFRQQPKVHRRPLPPPLLLGADVPPWV